jgi:HK97 family phage prohead protease/HK97 family phage major capsid protein
MNKTFYLSSDMLKAEISDSTDENFVMISGYASTQDVDRQGDVVPATVWQKGLENYLKNPVILAFHDHSQPVGKMVEHRIDKDQGLWIKAKISSASDRIFKLIKDGILSAFSIGFRVKDADYDSATKLFVVKELELHEISVVSVPANQNTIFSLAKAFDDAEEYEKFKLQFASTDQSAKGLENGQDAGKENKEWNMSPEEIKQLMADAAKQAAQEAAKSALEAQQQAAAELEAKRQAEAALEAKIKAAVSATVETGTTGAEKLLAEVEKRFAEQAESNKSAIAGLEAALKEKAAELEAIQRSKMQFGDKGNADAITYADKEKAILLAKAMGRKVEDTKFGKQLIEKAGAHQPTNANVNYWETEVSMSMEAEVRRRLVVAPTLRSIAMQTNVMAIPVNPEAGVATWVTNAQFGTSNSAGSNATHQLKEVILNSYKVATNEYLAYEEEEDSMIALMPIVRDGMVRRVARAVDRAYLRGAGSGSDPVKGIAVYDAASAVNIDIDGATIATGNFSKANSVSALRALRKDLGVWGLDPSELVYIVSQDVYYNLLDDTNFQTMDKVGTSATLLTGQIGSIGNTPVLVSGEFASEGAGEIAAICFAPANFVAGNQRGLRVDTDSLVETQRRVMVASLRTGLTQISTNYGAGVSTLRYVA